MSGNASDYMPPGADAIIRRLQELERRVDKLTTARILDFATVGGDGLQSIDFDGTLSPAAAGTHGWALTGDTGTLIVGSILLRNAIIGNDALTSPVAIDQADGTSSGYTYDSTERDYTTQYLTVPAGFTKALVFATATVGLSANASGSFVSARPVIGSDSGELITSQAGANIAMSVSSTHSAILTGVSGNIAVTARARGTTGGCVAGTGNARISSIGLFLR